MTALAIILLGAASISQGISIIRLSWVLMIHRRQLDRLRSWAIGTEAGQQWRP